MLGSAYSALDDKVPNEAAIALSPTVGWILLVCAVAVAVMFILQSDRWRRWWLQMEDPRTLGLFRIGFTFFVICNVNDLWEHFLFLFTDEGIFTADVSRQVFASAQFRGFGDGFSEEEPWGFFDLDALWLYLRGPKYSLLHFWDSPAFFWGHLIVFELCAVLFMVGFRTRLTGVLTFVGMNSLFFRNHLFWEGTELVYRCFLAYLVISRCGQAYSVDNWLRCRKLKKRGELSEPDGPGGGAGVAPSEAHPKGLQAIYRLVPAWPRRLMMLQLATIYTYTGIVKNGAVWARGDALYYALNMDHFYRFYPQRMSAIFGTNLFRLMTWVTHWWEVFFPMVIVGLVVRWAIVNRVPPLDPMRRWGVRACWLVLGLGSGALVWVTWPVHTTPFARIYFTVGWPVLLALIWVAWWFMGNRPLRIRKLPVVGELAEPIVLDRWWFSSWFLGRRVWLTLAVVFQMHLTILMNIGMFQEGMLTANIPFLTGIEIATGLAFLGRRAAKLGIPGIPERVRRGEAPIPAEDPTLPHLHRDAASLPTWSLFAALGLVVLGVLLKAQWDVTGWYATWIVALVGLGAVGWIARSRRGPDLEPIDPQTDRPRTPWAYGPIGRFLIGTLIAWQLTAVATWLMPAKDSLKAFRGASTAVFRKWLTVTQTDQSWGMFAPNPPRSNVFLKTLVHTEDGQVWDMKTDVYAPEMKPIPFIWNDRFRKMARRLSGGESGKTEWYRKWFARYHCRKWALDHGGESPTKVVLVKLSYRIPGPEHVRDKGWYVPEDLLERTGIERELHTEHCKNAVMGQLPNWIRERHGLPMLQDDAYRPWHKHRKRKWETAKKKAAEARAKAATEATAK